jgi:fermentation-respiration switch protein FrsA (DUF1100 family)
VVKIAGFFKGLKDMAKTIFPLIIFSPFLPTHYNNGSTIADIRVPKLIIHGANDNIVPFSMGKRLFEQAMEPKLCLPIPGAGHNDKYIEGGQKYFDVIATFIMPLTNIRSK